MTFTRDIKGLSVSQSNSLSKDLGGLAMVGQISGEKSVFLKRVLTVAVLKLSASTIGCCDRAPASTTSTLTSE
jgi:hypothetical protein